MNQKRRIRLWTLILTTVMFLAFSFSVCAASGSPVTKDGLTVSISTDKDAYAANEAVDAAVTVDNQTGKEVLVQVVINVPENVTLAGQAQQEKTLQAGQSWTTLGGTVSGGDMGGGVDSGDPAQMGLWSVLCIGAAGTLLAVLSKSKNRKGSISLLLCLVLIGGMAVAAVPAQAADVSGNLEVSCNITVDGQEKAVTATVNYVIYDGEAEPEEPVIPDWVIAQWNFADDAADKAANPLNAELTGDAKLENGYLVVNGAGALKSADAAKLDPGSLTLEAIVNFTPEQKSGDHWLFFKDLSFGLKIWVDGANAKMITQLQTTDKPWAGDSTWTIVNELFDGQDHHVAMTYNAETGDICIYVDYQLKDQVKLVAGTESKGAVVGTDFDLYMGAGWWADNFQQAMRGKMAQARISDCVVPVEEMLGYTAE